MKYLKLHFLIAIFFITFTISAQDNCIDCITNLDIELEIEPDIIIKQPVFNPEFSYQENLDQQKSLDSHLEQAKKNSENINAFIQPYKFKKRDNTNSNDRYQHNLDNFRLPVFTCVLPQIDANPSTPYTIEKITQLDITLKKYHFCINKSGEANRETFKYFIINKLDGKIIPSEGQNIQWATLPEHKQQSMDIMESINGLYDQRYSQYLRQNKLLQTLIQKFNHQGQ